jgi:hypothetical protein
MNTEEVIWANRNLAVLARLYKVRRLRSSWTIADERYYSVRLEASDRFLTATIDGKALRDALKGMEHEQAAIIRTLTALVRSLTS